MISVSKLITVPIPLKKMSKVRKTGPRMIHCKYDTLTPDQGCSYNLTCHVFSVIGFMKKICIFKGLICRLG